MAEKLRVLMVEDVEDDAQLILRELRKGGFEVSHERVETREAFQKALEGGAWDLVLADYRLPSYSGLDAVQDLRATGRDLPFVLISGTIDQETAVSAMRAGAHDYLMKGDLARMVPAVRRELREAKVRRQNHAAQAALAESEERYRQLVENAHEAIYVVQERKIVFANAMCAKLAGQTVAELLGRPVVDFAPEEEREILIEHHERTLRGQTSNGPEDFRFCPIGGGGERWLAVNAVRIDWNGRPATLNFATEITDRKRSERELQRQAMVLDQAGDTITSTDLEGTILYVNAAQCRALGRPREELLGKNVEIYGQDPARGATQRQIIERTLAEGKWHGEVVNRSASGKEIVVDCRTWLLRDEHGKPVGMCGVATDVTRQREAEAEQRRLAIAIEQITEAVMITDANEKIVYVNPAFTKLTGYSPEEALGQTPRILHSGRHDRAFYEAMWSTLLKAGSWSGRITNRRKDGQIYEEEISISCVRDADGKVVNYVGVKRDVTQELALQAQLFQSQNLETVGHLAAGVAHDFNNLLMVFGGCASLLSKKLPEETPVRSLIEEIRRAVSRGSGMTQQLLSLSRQQSGHRQPADLNRILDEVLKMAKHLVLEHIEIVAQPGPFPLWVVTDHNQLLQVLMNLIVNARDAMKDGGTLRLETAPCALTGPDPRFPCASPGDYAVITVADSGTGMSPEVQARIFEPFFTTKARGKGTGLGLAIAHSIVQQNKGHLHVRSRVGEGSEFSLLLPRCPAPEVQTEPDPLSRDSLRGTETVLLAEDEPKVRTVVGRILRGQGYRVVVAKDGAEALRRFEANPSRFPIVLSDVAMPLLNGLELARRVRALVPQARVILMSGYSDEEVMRQVLNEKEIPFLPKPVDADLLLRRVRQSLDTPATVGSAKPAAPRKSPRGVRAKPARRGGGASRAATVKPGSAL